MKAPIPVRWLSASPELPALMGMHELREAQISALRFVRDHTQSAKERATAIKALDIMGDRHD